MNRLAQRTSAPALGRHLGRRPWPPQLHGRGVTAGAQLLKIQERRELGLKLEYDSDQHVDKRRLRPPLVLGPRSDELRTANHALKTHIREGNFDAGWAAFEALENPDGVLMSAALHLCAKAGWWGRGEGIWKRMPSPRDQVAFSTMIALCAQCCKADRAGQLFQEMQDAGHEPNVLTRLNLLRAYSTARDLDRTVAAFRDMGPGLADVDVGTKKVAYRVVMTGCMRVGDYARTRDFFLEVMQEGLPIEPSHYTLLIGSCARSCNAELAEQIFRQMEEYGFMADVTHFTALVSCSRLDLQRCLEIKAEMARRGIKPSRHTYQELLEAHILANDAAGGRALLQEVGPLGPADGAGKFAALRARLDALAPKPLAAPADA